MYPTQIEESFDTFLNGNDAVLVVRGNWGVGKTYFWTEYIKGRIASRCLKQVAYSYISLFGKTSLADVRASIFQSGVPIAPDDEIERQFKESYDSSTKLLKSIPWLNEAKAALTGKARLARWITDVARSTPYTDKYTRLIATLEYKLVTNYLICIDDLERKGDDLSIREIMGLIDELATDKRCKVVLIFNDQSFSEESDKEQFDEYREKVVDIEIEYAPDHLQALQCAFSVDHPSFQAISNLTQALDIKNIRVLRKLRRLVDAFEPALQGKDQRITTEFLNHAAVMSWSYYMRKDALPYEFLLKRTQQSPWSGFLKKEEEMSEHERRYRELSERIDLTPSAFTPLIAGHLEKGYLDKSKTEGAIRELQQQTERLTAQEEINAIWSLYRDSFKDNADEIRTRMRSALERHANKLDLREFASGLELLSELGECVDSLIDKCVDLHAAKLGRIASEEAYILHRISFAPFRDRLLPLVGKRDDRTIDEVVEKIVINRGWNSGDVEFLASLTSSQLEDWMRSAPDNLPTKIRDGLLICGKMHGSTKEEKIVYDHIYASTVAALEAISASSDLNRLRVSAMYDLKKADESTGRL